MGNIKELFYYGEELSWNEGSSEQWDSYQRVKQRGIGLCVRVKIRKQKVFKIDSWIGLWAKHMNGCCPYKSLGWTRQLITQTIITLRIIVRIKFLTHSIFSNLRYPWFTWTSGAEKIQTQEEEEDEKVSETRKKVA